jgi:hypothetical protein
MAGEQGIRGPAIGAGVLLITQCVATTAGFLLLRNIFGYPETIRLGPAAMLPRLHELRSVVPYLFYLAVGVAGLCLFLASPLLDRVFASAGDRIWGYLTKYCGLAFGLTLYAGILRWFVLYPTLARYRVEGQYDARTIDLVWEAFHAYVGETVAEHVSFTFMTLWLVFISLAILKTKMLTKWLGFTGVILAATICYGNLEFVHVPGAFRANRLGTDLVGVWNLALGINLLWIRNKRLPATDA